MKNMKKVLSLVLALVMMMALTVAAGATTTAGSITITNPTVGQVYSVYKLFDVESVGSAGQAYKVNSSWAGFFAGDGADYIDTLPDNFVSWKADKKDDATVANFAKIALAYAKNNNIPTVASETVAEGATSVTFEGLGLGYYLVDSTVGTLCALDVNASDIEITDKNVKPTIEKTTTDNTENTKRVGETIAYQVVVHAKSGAQKYVLTDTMGTGLELVVESISANDGTALKAGTDYNVTATANGFTMTFTDTYLNNITAAKDITVTYNAKITAAAITVDELKNEAKLSFGEPGHTEETETGTVTSKVFKFDFVKHNSSNQGLENAKFSLYADQNCTQVVKLVAVDGEQNTYRVAIANDEGVYESGAVDVVTTPVDGRITIKGLGNNTYYLKEIEAPAGYNLLANAVAVPFNGVNITTNLVKATGTEGEPGYVAAHWEGIGVLNNTGTELPSTGGIGTTIFTVTGGLLMIGAAILFLTKKRSEV